MAPQNIKVCIRTRPCSIDEKSTIAVLDNNVVLFHPTQKSSKRKELKFAFDRVFDQHASQQYVFEETTLPLIQDVLDGYNATVFAYGATGCGKTHTITGTLDDPGIISRTMTCLFERIKTHKITISYLEVYNETIRDLLANNSGLDVREDDSRVVVAGLSEHTPTTVNQVMKLIIKGNENRTKAFTMANATSSRSHAVLQIHVKNKQQDGIIARVSNSTLSIIDLAGSERASATMNTGHRLIEGANINRSLLSLGNCINALCENASHIPYRDSKLTRLLKYSLSGSCKVVMIANVSPAQKHSEETQNTLKYANRAKNIQTKVSNNTMDVESHIAEYPQIIAALQQQVQLLEKGISINDNGRFDKILEQSHLINQKLDSKELELKEIEYRIVKTESFIALLSVGIGMLDFSNPVTVNDALEQAHSEHAILLNQKVNLTAQIEKLQDQLGTLHSSTKPVEKTRFSLAMALKTIQRLSQVIQQQDNLLKQKLEEDRCKYMEILRSNTNLVSVLLPNEVYEEETSFASEVSILESLISETNVSDTFSLEPWDAHKVKPVETPRPRKGPQGEIKAKARMILTEKNSMDDETPKPIRKASKSHRQSMIPVQISRITPIKAPPPTQPRPRRKPEAFTMSLRKRQKV